jgi:hypothetical protein
MPNLINPFFDEPDISFPCRIVHIANIANCRSSLALGEPAQPQPEVPPPMTSTDQSSIFNNR